MKKSNFSAFQNFLKLIFEKKLNWNSVFCILYSVRHFLHFQSRLAFFEHFWRFSVSFVKNVAFIRLTAVGHLNFHSTTFGTRGTQSQIYLKKWKKEGKFLSKDIFLQRSSFILCKCFEFLKQERKICWKLWSFVWISEMRFWV